MADYKSKALLRFKDPLLENRFITSFHQQCARQDLPMCVLTVVCYGVILVRLANMDRAGALLKWKPLHDDGVKDALILWTVLKILWSLFSLFIMKWPYLSAWYMRNRAGLLMALDFGFWVSDWVYLSCHHDDFNYNVFRQIVIPQVIPLGRTGPFRSVLPQRMVGLLVSLVGTWWYRDRAFSLAMTPVIIAGHGLAIMSSYGIDLWFRTEFLRTHRVEPPRVEALGSGAAPMQGVSLQSGGSRRSKILRRRRRNSQDLTLHEPSPPSTSLEKSDESSTFLEKSGEESTSLSGRESISIEKSGEGHDLPPPPSSKKRKPEWESLMVATMTQTMPYDQEQDLGVPRHTTEQGTQTPTWEALPRPRQCVGVLLPQGMNPGVPCGSPSGPLDPPGLGAGYADVAKLDEVAGDERLPMSDVERLHGMGDKEGERPVNLERAGGGEKISVGSVPIGSGRGAVGSYMCKSCGFVNRVGGGGRDAVVALGDVTGSAEFEICAFKGRIEEEWQRCFKLVEHKLASMKDPWKPIIEMPQH